LDQSEEARSAISEHGAVVLDRFGFQKPSPWVDIQHKAQNRFRVLCRELGLDVQSSDGPRMPRDATYGARR